MESEYLILKTGSEMSPKRTSFKLLKDLLINNMVDFILTNLSEWGPSLPPTCTAHKSKPSYVRNYPFRAWLTGRKGVKPLSCEAACCRSGGRKEGSVQSFY